MKRSRILTGTLLLATIGTLTACSDSIGPGDSDGMARIRIINSVFVGDDPSTAAPVAIDYLIDSSSTLGQLDIPAHAIWSGADGEEESRYRTIPDAIHSFVARIAGDTTPNNSLYRNESMLPYLPRQRLVGGMYYTIVVAGVIPSEGMIPAEAVIWYNQNVDDPFPGPSINGVYQARFKVINAAPFADASGEGTSLQFYVTPGATPPAGPITAYRPMVTVGYRGLSPYGHVNAGTYTITVVAPIQPPRCGRDGCPGAPGPILIQQPVTFASGEVRSFVIQSTAASDTPGPSNHIMVSLIDKRHQ